MKKILLFALLLSSGTLNNSCTQEEICKSIYLADMICSKVAIAVPTVETGVAFALTTIIKNVAESTNFCETETAGTSNTQFMAQYRSDADSPWEDAQLVDQQGNLTFEVFVGTPMIDPADSTGMQPGFVMETPGQYYFPTNADGRLQVDERNENNNGSYSGVGTIPRAIGEIPADQIITVVPSKDYVPQKRNPGEPIKVKYLGTKILF
ncbi:MAG: hypothetical protein IPL65_07760 [Lewinellaceae bacterium]|nr:hypothetical protein [Lewinellaceae bacterium]